MTGHVRWQFFVVEMVGLEQLVGFGEEKKQNTIVS